MSSDDEAGLIAAIAAAPDDDRPRLVYADWLTERGDPRGEMIVLACELARLGPGDTARGLEIEVRHRALVAEHGAKWTRDRSGRAITWELQRGLPQIAHTDLRTFLDQLADTLLLTGLEVYGDREQFGDDGALELAACPHAAGLRTLRLRKNGIGEDGGIALAESPHLAALRELQVDDGAGGVIARRLVRSPPIASSLRVLRLTHLGSPGVKALAECSSLRRLEVLDLRSAALRDASPGFLPPAQLPRLHSLSLGNNRLGGKGARLLAAIPWLSQLHTLDLSGNLIGAGLRALIESRHVGELRVLWLASSKLDRKLAQLLAGWEKLASVTELDLGWNGLGDAGVKALVNSPNTSSLVHLSLQHTGVGLAGVRALLDSPHLAKLRSLDLSSNEALPKSLHPALAERFGDDVSV